jgi:hypothetical protein
VALCVGFVKTLIILELSQDELAIRYRTVAPWGRFARWIRVPALMMKGVKKIPGQACLFVLPHDYRLTLIATESCFTVGSGQVGQVGPLPIEVSWKFLFKRAFLV